MQLNYPQKSNGLYILSRNNLEQIAEAVLQEHMPNALTAITPVNIKWLAEEEYGLEIKHMFLSYDKSILGMIMFSTGPVDVLDNLYRATQSVEEEGTIIIERLLTGRESAARYRFTLAHEFSHWLLHRSFHSPTNQRYEFRKASKPCYIACRSIDVENNLRHTNEDVAWQEWQANVLAANLLMPKESFSQAYEDAFRKVGYYCIPRQVDRETLYRVTKNLSETFRVSCEAAMIRMKTLNLYQEPRGLAG